jgi:hypothetical protein
LLSHVGIGARFFLGQPDPILRHQIRRATAIYTALAPNR